MKRIGLTGCVIFFFFLIFMVAVPADLQAKTVTYVKEYYYQANELDSKVTSRTIALAQIKRLLLEELGTYLMSESAVKDFELTKDQVSTYTAGIIAAVIIDEKWDGKTYYLKAKLKVDADEVIRTLNKARKSQEQDKEMAELREQSEEALRRIEALRKEMGKGKADQSREKKYVRAVNELNAIDWQKEGYILRYSRKNNQEAMAAFDKAIEINPDNARAYAGRAAIFTDWGQHEKALKESEQAVKLDPNLAWGWNTRGVAHANLRHNRQALNDFNKALELFPRYAWAYANRSRVYLQLKNYPPALEDAERAVEYDPNLAQAHFRKGRALAALDRMAEAIGSFDTAIELDPAFAWSYVRRGYARLKMGEKQRALDDMKKAASLGNGEARTFLSQKGISR